MPGYTTLEDLKTYLNIDADDTSLDSWLSGQIVGMSRAIDMYCRRHFDLRVETHRFLIPDPRESGASIVDPWPYRSRTASKLWFDTDLHSLTTFTNANGVVFTPSQYILY